MLYLILFSCLGSKKITPPKQNVSTVTFKFEKYVVKWDDGDTFSTQNKENGKKIRARLNGFNTLENYGPVHSWGKWQPEELLSIATEAKHVAASQHWRCDELPGGGGYGRVLVDCPDLRKELILKGLAHPFSIDKPAPADDIELMRQAIGAKSGMWAKGAPRYLLTSLHSNDENPKSDAYNRVCDLKTGQCSPKTHTDVYKTCEKVCVEDSCMIFVPYKMRYGENKAECLKN